MSRKQTSASDHDVPAEPGDDLVFVFSGFGLNVNFLSEDPGFDRDQAKRDLLQMAEEIRIDKTYVSFEGTRYKNVFLREDGWNTLSKYIWQTDCKSPGMRAVMRKAFESMITAYMEHVADLLGYDSAYIDFQVDPDSDIKLKLVKDTAREWERYPGPWQDWPENN